MPALGTPEEAGRPRRGRDNTPTPDRPPCAGGAMRIPTGHMTVKQEIRRRERIEDLRARSAIFLRRRAFSRLISASLTSDGKPPDFKRCSAFSTYACARSTSIFSDFLGV